MTSPISSVFPYNIMCSLHYEILAFKKYILPTSQEVAAREMVIDCISTLIKRRWPRVKIDVFGSVATNLLLPDGCVARAVITISSIILLL